MRERRSQAFRGEWTDIPREYPDAHSCLVVLVLARHNGVTPMKTINSTWFATAMPAAVGFGLAALCVQGIHFYGWSLFLGLPVVVGFLSAFCLSFRREVSKAAAFKVATMSVLLLGGLILGFAMDGIICLLIAFPLALCFAIPAAALGRLAGSACGRGVRSALPLLIVFLFPGLVAFDYASKPGPPVRSVTTSVIVHAPIEQVWEGVVAFPKITEPPSGIFCLGIAYPIEARIEGSGVGAVRHCIFSTGSFVEPITIWQQPGLLAFDVRSSPSPMKELSPYEQVSAPHLHGHMNSQRGQFRLVERGGEVVLEGTTWYTHTLAPQWYWGPISDYMIHRIHERVLNHIRRTVEGN